MRGPRPSTLAGAASRHSARAFERRPCEGPREDELATAKGAHLTLGGTPLGPGVWSPEVLDLLAGPLVELNDALSQAICSGVNGGGDSVDSSGVAILSRRRREREREKLLDVADYFTQLAAWLRLLSRGRSVGHVVEPCHVPCHTMRMRVRRPAQTPTHGVNCV